jgi:hypothetical protein
LFQAEFDIFNSQLQAQAPSFGGTLILDLSNSSIDLFLPMTTTDASVTNGTTDVPLISTMLISSGSVPKPSSGVMFGIGAACDIVLCAIRMKRCGAGCHCHATTSS